MSEISSGLVAVAWQVRNGWSSCDLHRTLKSATEYRDMLQKRADLAGNLMAYRVEPLVRLSDAEAIIAAKDAEIIEQCRLNGMGAERELALLGQIERQSAALKLAKDAFSAIDTEAKEFMSYENARNNFSYSVNERRAYERAMINASELTKKALAAIDALGE